MSPLVNLLHNNTIQELWLQGNDISHHGATELSIALTNNTSLSRLSLLGCESITHIGAVALTKSLCNNSSLSQLEMPVAFQIACEEVTPIMTQVKWFANYTVKSVVDISNKVVDCELLGESVIKVTFILYTLNVRTFVHNWL